MASKEEGSYEPPLDWSERLMGEDSYVCFLRVDSEVDGLVVFRCVVGSVERGGDGG